MPAMPHSAAGPRIEPPVSEPVPPRISPAATAAPVPDEEPAVKCSRFHGLRAGGQGRSKEGPPKANSCVDSLPSMTVPASAHFFDRMRIARRHVVFEQLRMRRRADAGGAVDVLVRDRDAVERPTQRARHLPRLRRLGIGQRTLLRHHQEGVELRIEALDAIEMRLRKLDGRELLRGDLLAPLRRWSGSPTSLLLHLEGERGFGFARQGRVHPCEQPLDDLRAGQDRLHLLGRMGQAGAGQQDLELGFVDR